MWSVTVFDTGRESESQRYKREVGASTARRQGERFAEVVSSKGHHPRSAMSMLFDLQDFDSEHHPGPLGLMPSILSSFFASLSGHGGGPRDGSHIGHRFDKYMRKAIETRFDPSETASRVISVWKGRRVRVYPYKGAEPADGTIENLTQWVRTPFDTVTNWSVHIKYDDPKIAAFLRGKSEYHDKHHEDCVCGASRQTSTRKNKKKGKGRAAEKQTTVVPLDPVLEQHFCRADPDVGGTFVPCHLMEEDRTFPDDSELVSFSFLSPANPAISLSDGVSCPICRQKHLPSAYSVEPPLELSQVILASHLEKQERIMLDISKSFSKPISEGNCNSGEPSRSGGTDLQTSSGRVSDEKENSEGCSSTSISTPSKVQTGRERRISHIPGDCPICLDSFESLLQLDCGHGVCVSCWENMNQSLNDEGASGFRDAEESGGISNASEAKSNLVRDLPSLFAARLAGELELQETLKVMQGSSCRNIREDANCSCLERLRNMFQEWLLESVDRGGRESMARVQLKLLVEPVKVCMSESVIDFVLSYGNVELLKSYIETLERRRTDFAAYEYFESQMRPLRKRIEDGEAKCLSDIRKMRLSDIRAELKKRVHEDLYDEIMEHGKAYLVHVLKAKRKLDELAEMANDVKNSMEQGCLDELAAVGIFLQKRETLRKWMDKHGKKNFANAFDNGSRDASKRKIAFKKRKRNEEQTSATIMAPKKSDSTNVEEHLLEKYHKCLNHYLNPLHALCVRVGERLESLGRYVEAIKYFERAAHISAEKGLWNNSNCGDSKMPTIEQIHTLQNSIEYASDVSRLAVAQKHIEDYKKAHNNFKIAMNVLAILCCALSEFSDQAKVVPGKKKLKTSSNIRSKNDTAFGQQPKIISGSLKDDNDALLNQQDKEFRALIKGIQRQASSLRIDWKSEWYTTFNVFLPLRVSHRTCVYCRLHFCKTPSHF